MEAVQDVYSRSSHLFFFFFFFFHYFVGLFAHCIIYGGIGELVGTSSIFAGTPSKIVKRRKCLLLFHGSLIIHTLIRIADFFFQKYNLRFNLKLMV